MLRRGLHWLSEQQQIFNFVRPTAWRGGSPSASWRARRIDDRCRGRRGARGQGHHRHPRPAGRERARRRPPPTRRRAEYVAMLDRMAQSQGVEVNVSMKLTQMGFDIDEELCYPQHGRGFWTAPGSWAASSGSTWRARPTRSGRSISSSTGSIRPTATMVGVVIQSALRRSTGDVERLIAPQGAGPALQGRLPRTAGGGLSPTRPTSTGTTSS